MSNPLAADLLTSIGHRGEALLDFVPRLTPRWRRPDHLAPVAALLERAARGEAVRACVSVPPQHGKTELLLHGIVWLLRQRPDWTIGYGSYNSTQARSKSRLCRAYADTAGLPRTGAADSLAEWRLSSGGGLLARGVGEGLTGMGCEMLIVDDPHKDRAEAESAIVRGSVWDWFTSTALTRLHPGAAVIVLHTRWHPDDMIGRLLGQRDRGEVAWEVVNLPAIGPDGTALAEWLRPLAFLEQQRAEIGEYDWASLYQGEPRPRGGQVFSGVTFYDQAPTEGYSVQVGVDLAYTSRTSSDYSVAVTVARAADVTYVLDVQRHQVRAPEFAAVLGGLRYRYPYAAMRFYGSGTEIGTVDTVNAMNDRLRLEAIPATVDKFQRAQPVAAAWNAGKVLVPRDAPWLDDFIREVAGFTGLGDRHDDQVDALAAAFDSKTTALGAGWEAFARRVIAEGGGIVAPEPQPETAPEQKETVIQ